MKKKTNSVDQYIDFSDVRPVDGSIADAAKFSAVFADPGDGSGLPDLAEPGE
jgi:hypothetical protein